MKSKLFDHLAVGPSPSPAAEPLGSRCSRCSHHRSCPGGCTGGPPTSCSLLGFPLGWVSTLQVLPNPGQDQAPGLCGEPLTMPADCGGRPGAAAGPGTGQGRHSAAPAAQISWHSALLNPLLRTSHYFRSSPSRLSSDLSPPAGQSLRRDVSHAAPATSVNLPPSSCDTDTSIIAPSIGPELRELTAGTLSTPRPLHPPRSSAGSGPHPRTGPDGLHRHQDECHLLVPGEQQWHPPPATTRAHLRGA